MTADEIDQPIEPAHEIDHQVSAVDAAHAAAGEDIEPPYLRLRTLVDETLVKETSSQAPDLDLTEFAVLAENTGVEVRRDTEAPPFPRTLIADVASFPHAMPTGFEPSTEVLIPAKKGLSFSRARLVGWGAMAFCAGLVASAAAHMVAAPARIGATANAATAITATSTPTTSATAPTPTPTPPAVTAPAAMEIEPTTAKAVAADGIPADAQPAVAVPAAVRTRSGASGQARGQVRARGKMRSVARTGSTDDPFAAEPTAAPAATEGEPAAPTKAHKPGWVDPFAE